MAKDKPPLTDEEIRAIAERRAASLKRIQELNQKKAAKDFGGGTKGSAGPKQGPPKGRSFRHQGR